MRAIYACDVGSTRPNRQGASSFAWARILVDDKNEICVSQDIELLVSNISNDISRDRSVALGFEAPLFIPVPNEAYNLSKSRNGEGNRSFSAPAGLAVATLAVHQAAWILMKLKDSCGGFCELSFDWTKWPPDGSYPILFIWEAFVSGLAHGSTHSVDAATAAAYFLAHENNLEIVNAVTSDQALSFIGAAALWSGWTTDLNVLRERIIVMKPDKPFHGKLRSLTTGWS